MKKMKGKYTEKFKSYAIKLVVEDNLSISTAAKQLSMPKATLSDWVKKAEKNQFDTKKSHNEILCPGFLYLRQS